MQYSKLQLGTVSPLPASSLRRQRGQGSTISNAGCCSEERSASKKHAQVRTQQSNRSRLRKTVSAEVRTLCEECEKHLRPIMLGERHPVHRTTNVAARSGLHMGFRGCRQRARLRTIRWNPSGHLLSCLCFLSALVQPHASLLWRATTCQSLLQSQRYTDVHHD